MKVYYHTFQKHIVSFIEKQNLFKAWHLGGIELVQKPEDADIIVIKAFSAPYEDFMKYKKPIIMHSFGVNYGHHHNLERDNEKINTLYAVADGVVYMSEFAKRLTKHYYKVGKSSRPETVIFNSQNMNLNYEVPALGKMSIKCATTGLWREWKRLGYLISLIRKWNETHEGKHRIELFVTGDYEFQDSIEDKNIHFLGYKDCKAQNFDHYKQMHFYLYPSLMETFGNSVAEAIGYGLPCMVTNFGATSEVIGDAGVALITEPEDYLNFSTRPVMYGAVPEVKQETFNAGMNEMIDNYEDYREKADKRSESFRHQKIGIQWHTYLKQFIK